jgi:hypothetical protein
MPTAAPRSPVKAREPSARYYPPKKHPRPFQKEKPGSVCAASGIIRLPETAREPVRNSESPHAQNIKTANTVKLTGFCLAGGEMRSQSYGRSGDPPMTTTAEPL